MNGTLPLFPDAAREDHAVRDDDDDDDEARAKRIVATLSAGLASSEEVFEAFAALDELDSNAVLAALRPWTGEASDLESLDDDLRRAHGFPLRRPRLRTRSIVRDADVLDLGPLAEEQLRLAGRSYDGRDLSAEDRLDGEVEDSFAGTLELHTLADAGAPDDAPARFEVYFFAGDAGAIFRAGTTEMIGGISYGAVEMKDRVLREAIALALAAGVTEPSPADVQAEPPAAAVEAPMAEERRAKKTVKKVAAKKVTAQEKAAVEKEAAPKRASPKKSSARHEAAPKKAAAKKVGAKAKKMFAKEEAAPKKAAVKKIAARKKTSAKEEAAVKKVAAKKPTSEKVPKRAASESAPTKKPLAKRTATKKTATRKTTRKREASS